MGLLVNTLASDEKYPALNRDNLAIPIQMQLSQKQKNFSAYFAKSLKSKFNFEHFENKDDPHTFFISKITYPENVVIQISKKSHFRGPIDNQRSKRAQELLKSASHDLYHIHRSMSGQLSWKESLLVTCQILGLLVNILAADEKYPVPNRDNLKIPIQMQLSRREKAFSRFYAAFFKFS